MNANVRNVTKLYKAWRKAEEKWEVQDAEDTFSNYTTQLGLDRDDAEDEYRKAWSALSEKEQDEFDEWEHQQ